MGAAQAQTGRERRAAHRALDGERCDLPQPPASAVDAVGACEQRDTLAKVLALAGFCHGSAAGRSGPAWTRCTGRVQQEATRATAQFQRMGGVFVLSAL